MVCVSCAAIGDPLCHACSDGLMPAPPRSVAGVTVFPAFSHARTGARLVHNLKYRRSEAAGRILAAEMARRVPPGASALVPIPRVIARRIAYGMDQTATLTRHIAQATGLPVVRSLRAPIWQPRLAATARNRRRAPIFTSTLSPASAVLIDDVLTTGTTMAAAIAAVGHSSVVAGVVATSAPPPHVSAT